MSDLITKDNTSIIKSASNKYPVLNPKNISGLEFNSGKPEMTYIFSSKSTIYDDFTTNTDD